jgi:transaldolase
VSAQDPKYKHLVDDAVAYAKANASKQTKNESCKVIFVAFFQIFFVAEDKRVEVAMDKLFVNFGLEILKIVPGRYFLIFFFLFFFCNKKIVECRRRLMRVCHLTLRELCAKDAS